MRQLTAAELFLGKLGEKMPFNFGMVAQVRGVFTLPLFKTALSKVRQRHPLLATRLIFTEKGNWHETEGVPEFSIQVTEGDWTKILADDLTLPFPHQTGPHVRFILVPNNDCTYVMIVCNHAVADGLSGALILRDILHYMAEPDASAEPLPSISLDDALPAIELPPFQFPGEFPAPPPSRIPESPEVERFYLIAWALDDAQTTALVERCRREKTSVHAALCVAFLVAHAQDGQSKGRVVSSPVNVRKRLAKAVDDQFGIFVNSGVKTSLDCTGEFWEMTRQFKASLDQDTTTENLLRPFYFFKQIQTMISIDQIMQGGLPPAEYDLSISNLGLLDFPQIYGLLHLEAIYGPAINALRDEKIVGVATVANRLTFTFTAHDWLIDRQSAEQLIATAQQELAIAVGW